MKYYISIITISASLLVMGCSNDKKEKKVETEAVDVEKMPTFILEKKNANSQISLPAEITGFQQVDIFAKVNSFVKTIKVDIGSDVREGQLLVELEAPEISSQLAAAQSRVHSQEAIYTASNSTYQRLFETSKVEGTISRNDLELALARKNADFAQLQATRAAYNEIQVMQSYLQIRAPFSGKITSRNINVGAYVGQGTQIPMLSIQDNKKLRLAVSVPENYSGYLKVGDELSFHISSLRGQKINSKIARMSGALDNRLRSQRVELDIENTTGNLLPGMIAEVILPLNSKDELFVIPTETLVTNSEGIYVIKVVNGKALRVKVELGIETGTQVTVFSDLLKPNDVLLAKGNDEIRDGTAIN